MSEARPQPQRPAGTGMPKWLIYGIVAKIVIVVAITVAVLYFAGIL